jgi:hypothetical protein
VLFETRFITNGEWLSYRERTAAFEHSAAASHKKVNRAGQMDADGGKRFLPVPGWIGVTLSPVVRLSKDRSLRCFEEPKHSPWRAAQSRMEAHDEN